MKVTLKNGKPRINVITLGCSKNLYDSEVLMGQLKAGNQDVVHEARARKNDIVIINTCGFIDNAKEESVNAIMEYSQLKEQGLVDKVIVTGCLSERYKPELEAEISNIDAFYGTNELDKILGRLQVDYRHELVGERMLTTPGHYAYFKIAEGCNRPCSFCAIPLMRGKHSSTPVEELVTRARALATGGVRELILIAQDLTYYGIDIYNKRALAGLLEQLADVPGIDWIRLQYAYPSGFPLEVLDVMNKHSNICKYLDMPLQHITNNMLSSMRRGITKEKTVALIDTIRQRVPDIALRTTLICGYPGETEADFEEMRNWVVNTRFDRLGCFTYSHEENTHAHTLQDNVPAEVKQERVDAIMEVQQDISYSLNTEKIGTTQRVLIDRSEGGRYIGRTQFDSPEVDNEVIVESPVRLKTGSFTDVVINDATEFDLMGTALL